MRFIIIKNGALFLIEMVCFALKMMDLLFKMMNFTQTRRKWALLSSVLNLLIIQTFGIAYEYIATALCEWENHRTETEYEDAV